MRTGAAQQLMGETPERLLRVKKSHLVTLIGRSGGRLGSISPTDRSNL